MVVERRHSFAHYTAEPNLLSAKRLKTISISPTGPSRLPENLVEARFAHEPDLPHSPLPAAQHPDLGNRRHSCARIAPLCHNGGENGGIRGDLYADSIETTADLDVCRK